MTWLIVTVTVLLAATDSVTQHSPAEKRVVRSALKVDYAEPINTLQDLVTQADAVIVARVVAARDASLKETPRTLYTARVIERLKDHPRVGETITVARPIGRVEYSDRILEQYDVDMPAFEPGKTYLLFLKWFDQTNAFWIVREAHGAAAVDERQLVRPFGRHAVIRGMGGKGVAEIRQRVQAVR